MREVESEEGRKRIPNALANGSRVAPPSFFYFNGVREGGNPEVRGGEGKWSQGSKCLGGLSGD